VTGTSGIARGVYYLGSDDNASFNQTSIDNSEITGATATIRELGTAMIGGSKLDGGAVSGSVTCAGVRDESYTSFASTCP